MRCLIPFTALLPGITTFVCAQDALIFKRTNATLISNALSSLASIESLLNAPPPSSLALQLTAVPTSLDNVATSPAAIASIAAEFASAPPEWFKNLDGSAQSFIISKSEQINSLLPVMESLQAVAGIRNVGVGTATSGSTVTSGTAAKTSSGEVKTVTSKAPITITATSEVAGEATTEATMQTSDGQAASGTAKSGAISSSARAGAASGSSGMVVVMFGMVGVLGAVIVL